MCVCLSGQDASFFVEVPLWILLPDTVGKGPVCLFREVRADMRTCADDASYLVNKAGDSCTPVSVERQGQQELGPMGGAR